jgi:hypothetical protein
MLHLALRSNDGEMKWITISLVTAMWDDQKSCIKTSLGGCNRGQYSATGFACKERRTLVMPDSWVIAIIRKAIIPVVSFTLPDTRYGLQLCAPSRYTQHYLVFGLCPSSSVVKTREHNVSETGSVSVLKWIGDTSLLGPLETVNLNHWARLACTHTTTVYVRIYASSSVYTWTFLFQ